MITHRRQKKLLCVTFLLLFIGFTDKLLADNLFNPVNLDTINKNNSLTSKYSNSFFKFPIFQSSYAAVPLLTESFIFRKKDVHFRQMRKEFIPNFAYDYDTYLQFVPLGMTFAMKSSGIKNHSSWGQLAVSSVGSCVLGCGIMFVIKHTYAQLRPDGRGFNSFPSGHTTSAFVNASILSHEYRDTYPWISIAGYMMAAVTGVSRIFNNRHWMHDVLAGAGIGIASTEIVYSITDHIFKNNNNKRFSIEWEDFQKEKPDYFNMYLSYNYCLNKTEKQSDNKFKYKFYSGSGLGLESSVFFNEYFGVNARIKADAYSVRSDSVKWAADSVFNIYSYELGLIFSYPLINRIFVGARFGLGVSHIRNQKILYFMSMPRQRHLLYSGGAFVNVWTDKHVFLRFYADYNFTKVQLDNKKYNFPTLSLGATVGLHF